MASHNDMRARVLIAQEAARIILEEGLSDFGAAKRKAAQRLGMGATRNLPRNLEIDEALQARQRLFSSGQEYEHLRALRRAAVEAMRLFEPFEPRLVGSVLRGTTHLHSDVNLHVFTDNPEDVDFRLMNAGIPFRHTDRAVRRRGVFETHPAVRFVAGEIEIEAMVFPYDGLREAPASPVDGRPMQRANLREVERLLREDAPD